MTQKGFVAVPPAPPLSRALCYKPLSVRSLQYRLVAGRVCREAPRFCYKPCGKKRRPALLQAHVLEALLFVSEGVAIIHMSVCTASVHARVHNEALNRRTPEPAALVAVSRRGRAGTWATTTGSSSLSRRSRGQQPSQTPWASGWWSKCPPARKPWL